MRPVRQVGAFAWWGLVVAGAGACLVPFSGSPLGYACEGDADCGAGFRCNAAQVCAVPDGGSGGGGGGAGGTGGGGGTGGVGGGGGGGASGKLWFAEFYNAYFGTSMGQFVDKPPRFMPQAGYYVSRDAATITRQVDEMMYAKIDAALSAWYGPMKGGDAYLLDATDQTAKGPQAAFRWAILDRTESGGAAPDAGNIKAGFLYVAQTYGSRPNMLRFDAGIAYFVDAPYGTAPCALADKWVPVWRDAGAGIHLILRGNGVVSSTACAGQPADWFGYIANHAVEVVDNSVSLSPGFYQWNDTSVTLEHDAGRFKANATTWAASNARFHLLYSYNNWTDGTSVEPSVQWPSDSGYGLFLDILHNTPK